MKIKLILFVLLSLTLINSSYGKRKTYMTSYFKCFQSSNGDGDVVKVFFVKSENDQWYGRVVTKSWFSLKWSSIFSLDGEAGIYQDQGYDLEIIELESDVLSILSKKVYDYEWGAVGGGYRTEMTYKGKNNTGMICTFDPNYYYDYRFGNQDLKEGIKELVRHAGLIPVTTSKYD